MKDKLAQWLEKQGFSLEMRAAAAFRRAGFDVKQSAHYYDRGLGKDREIDVVAARRIADSPPLVQFAIECKSSDKPWVVLRSDDTLAGLERNHCWGILTQDALDTFSTIPREALEKLPWYKTSNECGYSVRKAFVERDDAFAASAAVCKAAQYLVLPMQADRRNLPQYAVAFPLIVVDSPVFECRLASSGEVELIEVAQSEFLYEDHLMFDAWVRIRIVTMDAIEEFAANANYASSKIHTFLSSLGPPRNYDERIK